MINDHRGRPLLASRNQSESEKDSTDPISSGPRDPSVKRRPKLVDGDSKFRIDGERENGACHVGDFILAIGAKLSGTDIYMYIRYIIIHNIFYIFWRRRNDNDKGTRVALPIGHFHITHAIVSVTSFSFSFIFPSSGVEIENVSLVFGTTSKDTGTLDSVDW